MWRTIARRGWPILLVALALTLDSGCKQLSWRADFARFEQEDRENPRRAGGVVFVGSSSIYRWPVARSFPDLPTLNRGLAGSQIHHATRYADRLIFPYAPRVVVIYAGDNDIDSGKSPQRVLKNYQRFVAAVHQRLPDCRIIFVAIKPSPKRWGKFERMRDANHRIEEFSRSDHRLFYADVATPMIGSDGRPRPELYGEDGLHLTPAGYELWDAIVRPLLRSAMSKGSPEEGKPIGAAR